MDVHSIFDSAELHLVEVECGEHTYQIDFVSRLLVRAIGNMAILEVTCEPGGSMRVERYAFPLDGVIKYSWAKQTEAHTARRRKEAAQWEAAKSESKGECPVHGDFASQLKHMGFTVINAADIKSAEDFIQKVRGN